MLSEAFLRRLDGMRLNLRAPAQGGAGGSRRSRSLGSSAEFSDFREYAPGDDLRRVDWNAYARFDRLFLKLFLEERETSVHVLLDTSASMDFEDKWERARELCQLLSYLSLRGGERVTLYALGETAARSETLNGRAGAARAAEFLQGLRPAGETKLSALLPRLALTPGRGVSFLISDLMSPDGYETGLKSLLYRKQEAGVVQVLSQGELAPQLSGPVRLIDSETDEAREWTANAEALGRYQRALENMLRETQAFCHARGVGYMLFPASQAVEDAALPALSRAGLIG